MDELVLQIGLWLVFVTPLALCIAGLAAGLTKRCLTASIFAGLVLPALLWLGYCVWLSCSAAVTGTPITGGIFAGALLLTGLVVQVDSLVKVLRRWFDADHRLS